MARSRIVDLANFQQFTAINVLADPGHVGGKFIMPGGVTCTLVWTNATGRAAHNVLWMDVPPAFLANQPNADTLLTGFTSGANWTALRANLSTTTQLSAVLLRDFRQLDMPPVSSTGAGSAGTNAAIALPMEVALCLTLRTNLIGPANRGRMYVPGFASDQVIAGNVATAAAVNNLTAWASTIFTTMSGLNCTWSIGHPPRAAYTGSTGTAHPARGAGLVHITGLVVRDNHWDSQRRRGLK